jgi:predicted Fe-Mo cluster-binding NifX family protein
MLICIGSDGNRLESLIAKRFGHANYLILFNTETKTFESFINDNEGHNHDNLQEYLDKGVRVFIVGNIGPHAFEILKSGGSKVYLARKMSAVEALTALNNNVLKELLEPTVKKSMEHGKHEHGDEHNRHSGK